MFVMVVEYRIGVMVFIIVAWNVAFFVMIKKDYLKLLNKKLYKDNYIYTI